MEKTVVLYCFILLQIQKEVSFLILIGNEFQITEPNYLKEFLHLKTECTEGITSPGLDWKFMVLSLLKNIFLNSVPRIIMRNLVNFN